MFRWFVGGVCGLWGVDFIPGEIADVSASQLNAILATFHTAFNVCNVLILIWFIPQIEKLVCWIIPSKKEEDNSEEKLTFITGGLMSTSELSILQAWKEIHVYGVRVQRMFGMVRDLFVETDEAAFNKTFSRIEKYEGICDRMEVEIAAYLNQVADGRLSDQSKHEVHKMLRIVSEIESVGDANFNMSRYISHKYQNRVKYNAEQTQNVELMFNLLSDACTQMVNMLEVHHATTEDDFLYAANLENEINNFRDTLKAQNTLDVTEHQYDYLTGVNYMDIIIECEKMGDYIINVDEAVNDRKAAK